MLLIKRYGMPPVLTAVLYSIIYALFGSSAPYFGAGLGVVLALAYLMRVCDDICDYDKDKELGKAPLSRGILIVLCCLLAATALVLSLMAALYGMLLPLSLILLQLALPARWHKLIKPLFLPATVIALVYGSFAPNAWVLVPAVVLAAMDVALILIKERRDRA